MACLCECPRHLAYAYRSRPVLPCTGFSSPLSLTSLLCAIPFPFAITYTPAAYVHVRAWLRGRSAAIVPPPCVSRGGGSALVSSLLVTSVTAKGVIHRCVSISVIAFSNAL